MEFDVGKVVGNIKPLWIKFRSFNPIVRWVTYIFGFFGINWVYNFLFRKINNYPPGNYGLPIFGNLLILYKIQKPKYLINDAKYYKTLSMKYFGRLPEVTIHDLKIAKEIFVKDKVFKNTLTHKYVTVDYKGMESFNDINGKDWKLRRQLTHNSLNFLIDSKYLDKRIHSLVSNTLYPILDEYSNTKKEYYFREDLKYTMFQFLFVAYFGDNIDIPKRDGEYQRFLKLQRAFADEYASTYVIGLYFGLENIVGKYIKFIMRKGRRPEEDLFAMFQQYFITCKKSIKNRDNNVECYVGKQLDEQIKYDSFDDNKLIGDMWFVFATAFHNTLGQIETMLYYAAKNISAQELVYNELKQYYKNKPNGFEVKDLPNLHYFRAFVYETLRINNVIQSTLRRLITKKGFKIAGYNIPKNCLLLVNTTGIHFNPNNFGNDCNTFNMNRWLDNNNHFKMNEAFVLFGLGPRNCPGQSLAIREIFTVLAPLFIRYKFTKPNNIKNYNVAEDWFVPNVPQLPLIVTKR